MMGEASTVQISRAASEHGIDKVRCPHCGRRASGNPYISDVFDAIRAAVVSGKRVVIPGFGVFSPASVPGDELGDNYFAGIMREYATIEFQPARTMLLAMDRATGEQRKEATEQPSEEETEQ